MEFTTLLKAQISEELVDAKIIAEILNVTSKAVYKKLNDPTFPPPVIDLTIGKAWLRSEVVAWKTSQNKKYENVNALLRSANVAEVTLDGSGSDMTACWAIHSAVKDGKISDSAGRKVLIQNGWYPEYYEGICPQGRVM